MEGRGCPWKNDVVEAEVPHGCKSRSECDERYSGADDSASDDVVPVVVYVSSRVSQLIKRYRGGTYICQR